MVPAGFPTTFRVLQNRGFARFARQSGISDDDLCTTAHKILASRVDVDLGGGVYKQRIARKHEGKSGGFRTIVIVRTEVCCIFVHGFAKKDKANISRRELTEFKLLSKVIATYSTEAYEQAIKIGALQQIACEEGVSQ